MKKISIIASATRHWRTPAKVMWRALWVYYVIGLLSLVFAADIAWDDIGGGNLNLRAVLVDPDNPNNIYAGSDKAVLKTDDGGNSWRNVLSVKGENRVVNFIAFGLPDKNSLYAATGNGLFYSNNKGRGWNRIFQGKNYLERECTSIAILPDAFYLGTKGGLFTSSDKGRSWHKEGGSLGNSYVLAFACDIKEPGYIYVACNDGVYKTQDSGKPWEKIFTAYPIEDGGDLDEKPENSDEEGRASNIRHIILDPDNLNTLYLATSRGVYKSTDRGQSWEVFSDYGLFSRDVQFVFLPQAGGLYATTGKGIFLYKNNRWQELSLRLMAQEIKFLSMDKQNYLYAASDRGLFKANIRQFTPLEKQSSLTGFTENKIDDIVVFYAKNEPKVSEVQQAAIRYAEVSAEKIKDWRRKAGLKAVLPKLTVGLDRSEKTNYELYTSATTRYVYEGPRDSSNGWDVTLSWELGDLIWNDDQTSIDVRSRLMVQLRDDVLDEVTKLYFERIRVKMELDNLSIEDRKKRFEKELKLQELTAQLDGLTGGYFSSQIK